MPSRLPSSLSLLALTVVLQVILQGVATSGSEAQEIHYWTGAASNSWSDPANWSKGTVPPSGASVGLGYRNYPVIDLAGDRTVDSLMLYTGGSQSASLDNGTLTITQGVTTDLPRFFRMFEIASNVHLPSMTEWDIRSGFIVSGAISGEGGITKSGSGFLTLEGANTFTGSTIINQGELYLDHPQALHYSTVHLNTEYGLKIVSESINPIIGALTGGGTLLWSTQTFETGANGASTVYNGTLHSEPSGIFRHRGTGTLTIAENPADPTRVSWIGRLAVAEGELIVDNRIIELKAFPMLGSEAAVTVDDATLTIQNGGNVYGSWRADISRGRLKVIGNGSKLTGLGAWGMQLGSDAGAGIVEISSGGLVSITNDTVFASTESIVMVDRATFRTGGLTQAEEASGTISISDPDSGAALTVGSGNRSSTFHGTIHDHTSGPGSLRKIGTGKLTLTGMNTYTGDTLVDAGTLSLTQPYFADSADLFLLANAKLELTYEGVDIVNKLVLGGVVQSPGTHGAIGSGADFEWSQILGSGVLQVAPEALLAGDFNNDGIVNLADYTVWRDHLGAAGEDAIHHRGDGLDGVDAKDYALWKSQFGQSSSVLAPTTAVPEPFAASAILGLLALGYGVRRRNRRPAHQDQTSK
ncbi:autotransporter-associated beta strand repeat-containing protein [Aeoliella sp. SH292]|uniref:autotransporter-associated beta strand repeat-containing protein n=1 Tax=Aeoliella sp. SH292 TaxID=3454464 RepID=UPI003F9D4425